MYKRESGSSKSFLNFFLLLIVLAAAFVGVKTKMIFDEKGAIVKDLNGVVSEYENKDLKGEWEVQNRIGEVLADYDVNVNPEEIPVTFTEGEKSVKFSVDFEKNADFVAMQWPFQFNVDIPHVEEDGSMPGTFRKAKKTIGKATEEQERRMESVDQVVE